MNRICVTGAAGSITSHIIIDLLEPGSLDAALEHYPSFWQGHCLLCLSFAQGRDRPDEAFSYLEQAYELRDQQLVHAAHAGWFDPLQSDDRFEPLREKALNSDIDNETIMSK